MNFPSFFKQMRLSMGAMALLLGWMMSSCANENRLVVYADPWLEDYAVALCAAYEKEHPDIEISLKVISTEVIAQHIHFGQPIDVALCYGRDRMQAPDFQQSVAQESILAGSLLVEVSVDSAEFGSKQAAMQSTQCMMIEASDRPSRRYADAEGWTQNTASREVVIANFQRQAEDYLLRGWVPAGIVPIHFQRQNALALHEERRGALIPNAFTSILLAHAPHPAQAASFFAYTNAENSRQILGELKILP